MKFFIKTFGCQMNKSDSERIASDYLSRGYTFVSDWHRADEIVVNTCAVRQRAEDRVVGFLLNVTRYFSDKKKPKIILTGCMTHQGNAKLLATLPGVDEILPVNEVGFNQSALRTDKTHAWIPISSGCNSFCTFCIVPYARGRERSRPIDQIITEVSKLNDQGYQQLTLLGQNVNSYGLEKTGIGYRKLLLKKELRPEHLPPNQTQYATPTSTPPFVELLRQISKFQNIKKISFLTSNPWDFYDELIYEIRDNPKINRFLHIPIQSGSNRILKLMNRGYTREDYLSLVNKIRYHIPDAIIGTDFIVGFPTETQADFQETVEIAKMVKFAIAFVAQYSPRPGTAAYRIYPDDIPPAEKIKRFKIIDNIVNIPNLNNRTFLPK